jgi:hypothetical protein
MRIFCKKLHFSKVLVIWRLNCIFSFGFSFSDNSCSFCLLVFIFQYHHMSLEHILKALIHLRLHHLIIEIKFSRNSLDSKSIF